MYLASKPKVSVQRLFIFIFIFFFFLSRVRESKMHGKEEAQGSVRRLMIGGRVGMGSVIIAAYKGAKKIRTNGHFP